MRKGGFFKSNWAYLIWFALYFTILWEILGGNLKSLLITAIIYTIAITLALCPIGEYTLRLIQGARKPVTQRDTELLLPLFEEVYKSAKEFYPRLNSKIQIFISSEMYANAYAIGRKTIVVTRGLLDTMNEDEIKGILAHEFGHIAYGDTKALLLQTIGNGLFSIVIWVIGILTAVIKNLLNSEEGMFMRIIVCVVEFAFNIYILVFLLIGDVILALNSRASEYLADGFAHNIGYGKNLAEALYVFQQMDMGQKIPLIQRIRASHPHLTDRIARLENAE